MNNAQLTTFYIVRHGETDWNKKKLLQGHTDTPLNETGELQAQEVAKTLKHIAFDFAFSSDLMRAKRTVEIITLEQKLAVATTERLRERHFGDLEGKSTKDFFAILRSLEGLAHTVRSKYKLSAHIESDEEAATRVITFLRETAVASPGKTILVGTHGGVMRTVLLHLGHLSYEDSDTHIIKNGAYIKLESDGVDFFVKEVSGIEPL